MDLTQGTTKEKVARAKKTMMWFAMISMAMTFAGLTSAYVVSKSRKDWTVDLEFPQSFIVSLFVMIASSISLFLVKKAIDEGKRKVATSMLLLTFVLGVVFVWLQFVGFGSLMEQGYYFTGPTSNIVSTFMFIIVATHIVHLLAGLIVLLVLIYNHFKQKYHKGQTLGLELGTMYWHFVDVLWIYLFLFLFFVK